MSSKELKTVVNVKEARIKNLEKIDTSKPTLQIIVLPNSFCCNPYTMYVYTLYLHTTNNYSTYFG